MITPVSTASIDPASITAYRRYLTDCERASATVDKYIRDITAFVAWLSNRPPDKGAVLSYKAALTERYAPASVNAALSSLNGFFAYIERYDLRVRNLKIQRRIFAPTDRELSKVEYERLLATAKRRNNERLYLLMQAICSTGIRVSEVRYITVEAVRHGVAEIHGKGKRRQVFLPKQLCLMLRTYAQKQNRKCFVPLRTVF